MSGMVRAITGAILLSAAVALQSATAQVPGPQAAPARAAAAIPMAEIERLVARVALYPDELLAVMLRAATQPVQIVQAARFLDRVAKDKSAQPNPAWIEPVRILAAYPDVLRRMNDDLDWTERLGEAVQSQQADVLAAIQQFRHKAATAGNLNSDGKLTVVEDRGAYVIESVDPKVIYVPVYDPALVLVPQPAPVPAVYVPTPYPAYYQPYPAAAGFVAGALTTAWVMDWNNYNIDEDDIREFQQSRQQSRQDSAAQRQQTRQDSTAQRQQTRQDARPDRPPAQQQALGGGGQQDLRAVLGGDRPAQMPAAAGAGAGVRPGLQPQGGINWGGGERPGYQPQRQPGQGFEQRPGQSPDAFSYGSRRDTFQASDRGAQSRNFGGGGGRQFQGGGRRR